LPPPAPKHNRFFTQKFFFVPILRYSIGAPLHRCSIAQLLLASCFAEKKRRKAATGSQVLRTIFSVFVFWFFWFLFFGGVVGVL